MPRVGKKKFPYTDKGIAAAKKYARENDLPIIYTEDDKGGMAIPSYAEGGGVRFYETRPTQTQGLDLYQPEALQGSFPKSKKKSASSSDEGSSAVNQGCPEGMAPNPDTGQCEKIKKDEDPKGDQDETKDETKSNTSEEGKGDGGADGGADGGDGGDAGGGDGGAGGGDAGGGTGSGAGRSGGGSGSGDDYTPQTISRADPSTDITPQTVAGTDDYTPQTISRADPSTDITPQTVAGTDEYVPQTISRADPSTDIIPQTQQGGGGGAADAISGAASGTGEAISGAASGAVEGIGDAAAGAGEAIGDAAGEALSSAGEGLADAASEAVEGIGEGIGEAVSEVADEVSGKKGMVVKVKRKEKEKPKRKRPTIKEPDYKKMYNKLSSQIIDNPDKYDTAENRNKMNEMKKIYENSYSFDAKGNPVVKVKRKEKMKKPKYSNGGTSSKNTDDYEVGTTKQVGRFKITTNTWQKNIFNSKEAAEAKGDAWSKDDASNGKMIFRYYEDGKVKQTLPYVSRRAIKNIETMNKRQEQQQQFRDMKMGGTVRANKKSMRAKKRGGKFPDLTGDGKVTQADILKGRGVFKHGGKVKKDKNKKGKMAIIIAIGRPKVNRKKK